MHAGSVLLALLSSAIIVDMTIGTRRIGKEQPCFIVAELSGNHLQHYDEAVMLIRAAKNAGVDAVKLQTYTPDTITLDSDREWFRVGGAETPEGWKGKTLYDLYTEAYTPWEWQPKLKRLADELGLILFSTPFDETAVDFLEDMRVPCYKIASYEATDFVLLRKVAQTKKPVILSVGYASADEVQFALDTLRTHGAKEIAVLHCVTSYAPEPQWENLHLQTIEDIRRRFDVVAGFSDNNGGIDAPIFAAALGASIIEKHLTLARSAGGPDAQFSLEPRELAEMVQVIRENEQNRYRFTQHLALNALRSARGVGRSLADATHQSVPAQGAGFTPEQAKRFKRALGAPHYGPANEAEAYNMRWRRSLFSGQTIKKGALFTPENVRDIRPAFGLPTKFYDQVIGKRARIDIPFATPLTSDMIEGELYSIAGA